MRSRHCTEAASLLLTRPDTTPDTTRYNSVRFLSPSASTRRLASAFTPYPPPRKIRHVAHTDHHLRPDPAARRRQHRTRSTHLRFLPRHRGNADFRDVQQPRRRVAAGQQARQRGLSPRLRRLHTGHPHPHCLGQQMAVRADPRAPGRQGPDALDRYRRPVFPQHRSGQAPDHARAAVLAHQRAAGRRRQLHVQPALHARQLRQPHPAGTADRHAGHGVFVRRQFDAGRRAHGRTGHRQGMGRHFHRRDGDAAGFERHRFRDFLHHFRLCAQHQSAHRRRRAQHAGGLRQGRRHGAGLRLSRQQHHPVLPARPPLHRPHHHRSDGHRSHRRHRRHFASAHFHRLRLRHRPMDRPHIVAHRLQPRRLRLHPVG